MNKANATDNAKIEINAIERNVPHYTPSMEQQKIISEQVLSKILTELQHVEIPVLLKEVKTRNFRNCGFEKE